MNKPKNKLKVALVTGASSGMGKDFAKALKSEGMVVYGAARRIENMKDLEAIGVIPLKMDITVDGEVRAVAEKINQNNGGVDVLINNAGFGLYGPMEDIPLDVARYQFEVNLFGLARLTQLLLPNMRSRKSGKIINISSMGGKIYTPLGSWYHATKHALEGWSDCLRLEIAPFGIQVVVIEPGGIETEFGEVMMRNRSEHSKPGSAYKSLMDATDKLFENMQKKGVKMSEPKVITKLILKAVRSKKSKTRYVAGKYAKPMLFIRKWFGDRAYDKAVMSMFR